MSVAAGPIPPLPIPVPRERIGPGVGFAMGVPYAAIIGQREAESGTVTLRNMSDRTQEEVGMGDVARLLAPR